jgi:membrane protease YdiL (CAAX protease family)
MPTDDVEIQRRRQRRGILLLTVVCEGSLCGLAFVLSYWWDVPLLPGLYWDPSAQLLGIFASLPLLVLFVLCLRWPIGPLKGIARFCREVIGPLFASCTWYELAGIALLAGLGEELLFRGVLQVAVSRWLGPATALIAVSVLFGLLHSMTPAYAVIAGLMGFYLGCLWIGTGNLLVPILAHALYDFVALVWLARGPVVQPMTPPPDRSIR